MAKAGIRSRANAEMVTAEKRHDIAEAVDLLKSIKKAKFDETVEVAIKLGVNPKKSDQMVRGVVKLPNGTGRTVRVLVFAKGDQEQAAKDAGADFVGAEDVVIRCDRGTVTDGGGNYGERCENDAPRYGCTPRDHRGEGRAPGHSRIPRDRGDQDRGHREPCGKPPRYAGGAADRDIRRALFFRICEMGAAVSQPWKVTLGAAVREFDHFFRECVGREWGGIRLLDVDFERFDHDIEYARYFGAVTNVSAAR